MGFMRPQRH